MSNGNSAEASTSPSPAPSSIGNNAPKFGTLVPNRVFVGGISGNTTEQDLLELFTKYGKVKATKVINDRAGVSKGYGFVTFETEEEARKLTQEADNIMLKDRKLNIAPAIKKQVSDLGYIKPYSPRLVDGSAAATVLGTNGTVFFGNGTTYAYSPMPVLANPNDYHQAVAGVPNPTAAHPTFPPQVPQTGAHTAVSAATQVGGTPAAGYPTQFVYPQTMYIPQQFQQFQTAALQPQWTTSPQWRWVSPNAYAQPGAGYITSDGLYTQAAATYVPESSSLSGEATLDQSCPKGAQTSPPIPSVTPQNSFPFSPSPFHSCFPTNSLHSSSSPIVHSHIHNTAHPLATVSVSSPLCMAAPTSATTITTTTTTAVIGSGPSFLTRDSKSCETFGNGVLEIKPLVGGSSNRGFESTCMEHESIKTPSNGEDQINGIDPLHTHQTTSPTPLNPRSKMSTSKTLQKGHQNTSESGSSSSEDSSAGKFSASRTSIHLGSCGHNGSCRKTSKGMIYNGRGKDENGSIDSSTPSPDRMADITRHSDTSQSVSTPSPPLCSHSQSSSGAEVEGVWPLTSSVVGWSSWCPQHNSAPVHVWPQTSFPSNSFSSPKSKIRKTTGASPFCRMSETPVSQQGSPQHKASLSHIGMSGDSQKPLRGRDESLIGKPFLKVDGAASSKTAYGVMPQNPVMMVPWYQYGPAVNPPWFLWPPLIPNNCLVLPPSQSSSCSFHPPTQTSPSTQFPAPVPNSHTSPTMESAGAATHSHMAVQQMQYLRPPRSPPDPPLAQVCKRVAPSNSNYGAKGRCNSWWLNGGVPSQKSVETRALPLPVGSFSQSGSQIPSSADSLPYYSPLGRGSLPFAGEPVRCLQRLTQLPDDRCALLPISPPLTPHQMEIDSRNLPSLTRN